jgi:hypothetical protein
VIVATGVGDSPVADPGTRSAAHVIETQRTSRYARAHG